MPEATQQNSADLVARIRKNREIVVDVGTFKFTCRRPTTVEAHELARRGALDAELARDYVIDWANVTEDDVVGGGGSDKLTFDRQLWREWCADREDFWGPIAERVMKSWKEYDDAQKAARKN